MRKPVFGVSDQVRHKAGCTAIKDGEMLEISDLGSQGIVYYTCSENKGADQLRGNTARLICVFVFAKAKSLFSHDETHLVLQMTCAIS